MLYKVYFYYFCSVFKYTCVCNTFNCVFFNVLDILLGIKIGLNFKLYYIYNVEIN